MSTILIRDLSNTATLPKANDYLPTDGATEGTAKVQVNSILFRTNTRATLAALSVTGVATGTTVQVLGAVAPGDNGGGLYYYNSSSVATPDGINVIQPTVGAGRWLVIRSPFLPLPTAGALGGVRATPAQPTKFVTTINPVTGELVLAAPVVGDIAGLGTMALQNATQVTITGGIFDGGTVGMNVTCTVNANILSSTQPYTNTVPDGVAPMVVTSKTRVANLNVERAGVADTVTQNANLTGPVTSVGNATAVQPNAITNPMLATGIDAAKLIGTTPAAVEPAFTGDVVKNAGSLATTVQRINGVALGNLATGILKNTAVTGVPSIAAPADFPVLNQNTTGNAASATKLQTPRNINGVPFDGTADITIPGGNAGSLAGATLAPNVVNSSLTKLGVLTDLTTGPISSSSLANLRTTKANLNLLVNVKDYGAVGNGVANDSAAIATAISNLPTNGLLYFPGGIYLNDGIVLTGKLNVTMMGDGRGVTILKRATAGNTLAIRPTCSDVTVRGLTINNNNNARTAGQHGLTVGCSRVTLVDIEVVKAGQHAILTGWDLVGGVTVNVSDITISNVLIRDTYADGIHIWNTTRCVVDNCLSITDDDCYAVETSAHIAISGCVGTQRNDLGTNWGRGIAVFGGSTDVVVDGCEISFTKHAGIRIERAGGNVASRVMISNTLVYNCGLLADSNLDVEEGDDITILGCTFRNAFSGNEMVIQRGNRITISGCEISSTNNAYARGITTGDTAGSETINGFFIVNNTFSFPLANQNEGIRLSKSNSTSGPFYSNVVISGNSGIVHPSEYLVYTANMDASSKVFNNTAVGPASTYFHDGSRGGSTPANGNNV